MCELFARMQRKSQSKKRFQTVYDGTRISDSSKLFHRYIPIGYGHPPNSSIFPFTNSYPAGSQAWMRTRRIPSGSSASSVWYSNNGVLVTFPIKGRTSYGRVWLQTPVIAIYN
ncbi:hypothetical protein AVEN_271125-1 [Araneus ventricosus]|uniref:Uncharacterized protein n=1 Tax=Araneus ventricosus TaxID=182803 RepID=A0A4Y2E3L2_ARAVE|nr:hypothetical protein AVEN_271125-1 [Araneus ventricosus]